MVYLGNDESKFSKYENYLKSLVVRAFKDLTIIEKVAQVRVINLGDVEPAEDVFAPFRAPSSLMSAFVVANIRRLSTTSKQFSSTTAKLPNEIISAAKTFESIESTIGAI